MSNLCKPNETSQETSQAMRPAATSVHIFTTCAFVAALCTPAILQTVTEWRRYGRIEVLELFQRPPTAANLRELEDDLERASLVARWLRPPLQYAQFRLLADAGEKAIAGRDGWLFYRAASEGAGISALHQASGPAIDPLPAILSFRDQLAQRGIRLLVVPVPNKENIHPEKLTSRAAEGQVIVCGGTRAFLERLAESDVQHVDLFATFREAKADRTAPAGTEYYLAHDTHWSPAGMRLAAEAVAQRLLDLGWLERGTVPFDQQPVSVERLGDLLEMLRLPKLLAEHPPQRVQAWQIFEPGGGTLYRDDPASEVLVLGDSFLRIYQQDEPGSAGFIAHLAQVLQQPLASIINDGGGATLVRQELARRPELVQGRSVVVWQFVQRDIRSDTQGWPIVALPPPSPHASSTLPDPHAFVFP
jgi:hypothetical protein